MSKFERVRLEMLLRVRDFGKAHASLFPESSTAGKAFARVAEAAARIEANTIAKPVALEGGRTTKAAARDALRETMLEIAHTARGLAAPAQGGPHLLQMPKSRAEQKVIAAAQRFVTLGEGVRTELVALGMSPNALSRLAEAITRYKDASEDRRHNRGSAVQLQHNLEAALEMGLKAVRQLDVVVPNLLREDPGLMANWRTNRRVLIDKRKSAADSPPAPAEPVAAADETMPKAS